MKTREATTMTAYGTFEELIANSSPGLQEIAAQLRALILEVHPTAVEVVRLGDRGATYGLGPKKMSDGYCYISPHSAWINFGFYKGASLPDPLGLLEGTGKQLRHIKIHTLEDAERNGLRPLLEAALAERREALSLTG
jgi:hypothetical protein